MKTKCLGVRSMATVCVSLGGSLQLAPAEQWRRLPDLPAAGGRGPMYRGRTQYPLGNRQHDGSLLGRIRVAETSRATVGRHEPGFLLWRRPTTILLLPVGRQRPPGQTLFPHGWDRGVPDRFPLRWSDGCILNRMPPAGLLLRRQVVAATVPARPGETLLPTPGHTGDAPGFLSRWLETRLRASRNSTSAKRTAAPCVCGK